MPWGIWQILGVYFGKQGKKSVTGWQKTYFGL